MKEEPGFDDHGPTIGGAKPVIQRINAVAAAMFARTNNFTIPIALMNAKMRVTVTSHAALSMLRELPFGENRGAR